MNSRFTDKGDDFSVIERVKVMVKLFEETVEGCEFRGVKGL